MSEDDPDLSLLDCGDLLPIASVPHESHRVVMFIRCTDTVKVLGSLRVGALLAGGSWSLELRRSDLSQRTWSMRSVLLCSFILC